MAFLDINPVSAGHCQVIPKKHFRWVWDLPSRPRNCVDLAGKPVNFELNISDYFEIVKRVALAQRKAFGTDWVLSKIVGDEIEHAHIWVYPASAKVTASKPNSQAKDKAKDFEINADKIKSFLD